MQLLPFRRLHKQNKQFVLRLTLMKPKCLHFYNDVVYELKCNLLVKQIAILQLVYKYKFLK